MGYNIKEIREKNGITQAQLAEKSGVSRVTIAMLETRDNFNTTTKTLLKIADALGTTVDALFFASVVQSTEQSKGD